MFEIKEVFSNGTCLNIAHGSVIFVLIYFLVLVLYISNYFLVLVSLYFSSFFRFSFANYFLVLVSFYFCSIFRVCFGSASYLLFLLLAS